MITTTTQPTMTHSFEFAEVLANRWLKAEHTPPTKQERIAFRLWLMWEKHKMAQSNVEPLFVMRDVHLSEVMHALSRPVLPGEKRWFPVSMLNNEPHPDLMSPTDNLWFRAVHDFTHWRIKADDSMDGEIAVAQAHIDSAPDSIHWILWSEVAGQAAVAISNGQFPQQKLARII